METTRRLLVRNTRDGKLGGVAAGIGDYLGVDPVLVRLAFILLVFAGGAGLLLYLAAWAIIPSGDATSTPMRQDPPRSRDARWLAGAALITLGAVFLVGLVRPWWFHAEILWPLLLVAAGGALLLWRRDGGDGTPASPGDPREPGPIGEPAPVADAEPDDAEQPVELIDGPPASEAEDLAHSARTPEGDTPLPAGRKTETEPPQVAAAAFATEATAEYPTVEQPVFPAATTRLDPGFPEPPAPGPFPEPRSRRRYLPIGWITLGAILASAAAAALLDVTGALDVPVEWFLVYALGLSGVGIVAAAWYGRIRGPLTVVVLTGLALAVVAVVEVPLRGGVGEQTVQPTSIDELASEYRLGVGKLVLDLRKLELSEMVRRVEAGVSVGELIVLLPPNAVARVDGRASVGEVQLFDTEHGGIHVDESYPGPVTSVSPPPLTLDLEVGVGRIETRTVSYPPAGASL